LGQDSWVEGWRAGEEVENVDSAAEGSEKGISSEEVE